MGGCEGDCGGASLASGTGDVDVVVLGENQAFSEEELLGVNPILIVGRVSEDSEMLGLAQKYGISVVNLGKRGDFWMDIHGNSIVWEKT
jgi:hypothetical protein